MFLLIQMMIFHTDLFWINFTVESMNRTDEQTTIAISHHHDHHHHHLHSSSFLLFLLISSCCKWWRQRWRVWWVCWAIHPTPSISMVMTQWGICLMWLGLNTIHHSIHYFHPHSSHLQNSSDDVTQYLLLLTFSNYREGLTTNTYHQDHWGTIIIININNNSKQTHLDILFNSWWALI